MNENSPPSGGFTIPGTGGFGLPNTGGFDFGLEGEPTSSLVRPYARTGGRTKAKRDLNIETLVSLTQQGRQAASSPMMSPTMSPSSTSAVAPNRWPRSLRSSRCPSVSPGS